MIEKNETLSTIGATGLLNGILKYGLRPMAISSQEHLLVRSSVIVDNEGVITDTRKEIPTDRSVRPFQLSTSDATDIVNDILSRSFAAAGKKRLNGKLLAEVTRVLFLIGTLEYKGKNFNFL